MKSIKDIENMSLEQLEAASMDESISVPEGFTSRLQEQVVITALTDSEAGKVKTVRFAAIAASAALLVGIGLGIAGWQNEPKDTFSDPYLAYAELEKAFTTMAEGMQKGFSMAEKSEEIIDRTASVFSE